MRQKGQHHPGRLGGEQDEPADSTLVSCYLRSPKPQGVGHEGRHL